MKNAFNEVLRIESPISCFTRVATGSTEVGGIELPEGARVLVMFASANRDERRWERAETSTSTARPPASVGFGDGVHACAGMGLARLEGAAVLVARSSARVERIELGPARPQAQQPDPVVRRPAGHRDPA